METPKTDDENCPYCHAKMKKYWYRLSPALVDILIMMVNQARSNDTNAFKIKELKDQLSPHQYTQSTKLRFHGLIFKVKDDDGKWSGEWGITKRAGDFLRGDVKVPAKVQTFRNKVVDHDDVLVSIRDVYGSIPYIEALDHIETETATEADLEQARLQL